MVYEGVRLRSTEVDRGRPKSQKYLGHVLVVRMDLEAQTLSELKSFYVLSIYIGFGSRRLVSGTDFIKDIDLFDREGSMFDDFVTEQID